MVSGQYNFLVKMVSETLLTHNKLSCSRFEKGKVDEIEILKEKAIKRMPMIFEIFIVQPSGEPYHK